MCKVEMNLMNNNEALVQTLQPKTATSTFS